jgi:hypothetical protein
METSLHNLVIINNTIRKFEVNLPSDILFPFNSTMQECEKILLKCIVVTPRCMGQMSILKVGGGDTTYILPPKIGGNNVFFSIVISKVWGQPPPVPLHRNSTCQVYSSQLEVT